MQLQVLRGYYGFDIGIEAFALLVLMILMASIIREGLIKRAHAKYFLGLAAFQFVMVSLDMCSYFLMGNPDNIIALKILAVGSFVFMSLGLFWFNYFLFGFLNERTYVQRDILYLFAFLCGATALIYIVGVIQPVPWFFDYVGDGEYTTTKAVLVLIIAPLLILMFDLMLIISCRKSLNNSEMYALVSYEIFPAATLIMSFWGLPESISYVSGTISLLLLYTNLHVIRTKELADDELELSESKVKLLISQMQPHFMYNSLNSIYYLIGKDPALAQDALNTFSCYLRDNINSLRDSKTIPIEEELRHIDAYLKMEKLRFGDDLNFEFDIKENDFCVPALSIQPLVENAVKHGITQKEEGGTVKLSTYSDSENYYIKIEDDGVGFDARSFKDNHASSHIGIFNVNSRIKIMCHGNLSVTSEVGKGTVSLVTLPKDGQKAYKTDNKQ